MLTFAKFGGKCEYSDDAHSIGAILEYSVVFCIFTTLLSSVGCALIGKIIEIINRVFELVISTKIKKLLITNILICNVNYFISYKYACPM